MKKETIGACVLTLAGVAFLAGCAFGNTTVESKNVLVPVEQKKEVSKSENIEYTNPQKGFRLEFPVTWKDYTVTERALDWGKFGKSNSVDFGFGEQNSIFNIAIHSKEQWKNIEAEQMKESVYMQTYLGENKDFVFSFASTGDVANDAMYDRLSEVQSIIKTFEVK